MSPTLVMLFKEKREPIEKLSDKYPLKLIVVIAGIIFQ